MGIKQWWKGKSNDLWATGAHATLYRSCHIALRCRFNASIRMQRQGRFTFLTATLLSLGLILLPLLRLSGVELGYSDSVVDGVLVFLATAVLVYSVINWTANYEARAHVLHECASRLKALSRQMRQAGEPEDGNFDVHEMGERYDGVVRDSENHAPSDYWLVRLRNKKYFEVEGLPRWRLYGKIGLAIAARYALSVALIMLEVVFILDALRVTTVLTDLLAVQ